MRRVLFGRLSAFGFVAAALVACGGEGGVDIDGAGGAGAGSTGAGAQGSGASTTGTGGAGNQGGGGGQGGGGPSSSASSGASSSASTGASSSSASSSGGTGLATLGTLVVLGDSISDGGGQPPFYYNLLKTDLTTRYGNISYQNKANSGSKTGDLVSQINGLPGSLPGPVAVTITSGGNDMKAALPMILFGTDAAAKAQMGNNVKAALDALLQPNRFGAGVVVHVYEGNIYDASDGAGDYGTHGCAFGQGLPAIATDGFFDAWNGVILDQVTAHGQTQADMHAHFYGHGYKSSPNWYASDCTHPSQTGHGELRKLFYEKITGESLP